MLKLFGLILLFGLKIPEKTAVNAMNCRTNDTLKSEYFAEVRGFRYNKQQAAGLCVWAISNISRWPVDGNHTA